MTTYFATDPTCVRLAVSAVVRARPGSAEILLMRRSDNRHWGLPGGYVEPGESVTQAAAREVSEETGYRIEVGALVGVYSDPSSQVIAYSDTDRIQSVNLCFEALALEAGEPTTPEESLGSGFFPRDALPEPLVPIHGVRIRDAFERGGAVRVR